VIAYCGKTLLYVALRLAEYVVKKVPKRSSTNSIVRLDLKLRSENVSLLYLLADHLVVSVARTTISLVVRVLTILFFIYKRGILRKVRFLYLEVEEAAS